MYVDEGRVPRPTIEKCLFLLSTTQCRTHGTRLSPQEETTRKWGKSLTLTIGANESTNEDGVTKDLTVRLKIARDEPTLHLPGGTIVEAKKKKNGAATQGVEDSPPGTQEK